MAEKIATKDDQPIYTADVVADVLSGIGHDKKQLQYLEQLRPGYELPTFSQKEMEFIRDLIFLKDGRTIVGSAVDAVMSEEFNVRPFNGPTIRRLKFFHSFIGTLGNAAKAARYAGYSPKSAKQQGYRTLKFIQDALSQR